MLYIDGVFDRHGRFYPLKEPSLGDLDSITHQIARRVSRYLEKAGYLVRDAESAYLDLQTGDDDAMVNIVGASISYRLAFGPNAGRKALTLQTLPTSDTEDLRSLVTEPSGFSLHTGVSCTAGQHKKLERLCRYVTRPAISEQRLSIAGNGNVIYALKTPYSDGTTHVVLSPLEFIGRLTALVPKPRVNLARFHGVFSPNSKLREKVVPAKLVQDKPSGKPSGYGQTWAQRLKRIFAIDIEKCEKCGGNSSIQRHFSKLLSVHNTGVLVRRWENCAGCEPLQPVLSKPPPFSAHSPVFVHHKCTLNPGHLKSATLGTAGLFYLYPASASGWSDC